VSSMFEACCDACRPCCRNVHALAKDFAKAGTTVRCRGKVVATFPQGAYLGVKADDAAKVIFPMYPKLVFTAKVIDTIDITSGGQVPVGGVIPDIPSGGSPRFAAILKLDEPNCACPPERAAKARSIPRKCRSPPCPVRDSSARTRSSTISRGGLEGTIAVAERATPRGQRRPSG
jgi:hypothetical protein